ncbi:MAG: C39 family peptidase [Prochlorotrichaceae cyanobacterium]
MPKAIALQNTFLKAKLLGSEDLKDSEKIFVPKDHVFYVVTCAPARNQHYELELASGLPARDGKTQLQNVFGYIPHIDVEGAETSTIMKLPVKYCSQLDNDPSIFGPGWRQCNTTSNTMLADFLLKGELSRQAKAQGYPEPESVYMRIVQKYGDTTDHGAQTKALRDLKIESYFSYSLSPKDVLMSLQKGIPVVVGFAYKSSGHICIIVGYDPANQDWLVHDPYGTRHGASNSYDVGVGGEYDRYTNAVMQQIFWDQGSEAGWGRIVTSVNGQPTGLPTGL